MSPPGHVCTGQPEPAQAQTPLGSQLQENGRPKSVTGPPHSLWHNNGSPLGQTRSPQNSLSHIPCGLSGHMGSGHVSGHVLDSADSMQEKVDPPGSSSSPHVHDVSGSQKPQQHTSPPKLQISPGMSQESPKGAGGNSGQLLGQFEGSQFRFSFVVSAGNPKVKSLAHV
mmetsp:Transcript_35441/g.52734  ORF Transcript_35441/g.52734 Transcript_35441/m.52734 type:complete len:169 (-) Transcript_35441:1173-1679(-)